MPAEAYKVDAFGIHTFMVVPAKSIPPQKLFDYWNALYKKGTLKYRFSNITKPTPIKALNMMQDEMYQVYHVMDTNTGLLIGEFALENFTGKAAQIHFSMHPNNETKVNLDMARTVADMILNEWKDLNDTSKPFLETLYGMTPVDNRVACLFVLRVGLKKVGILPNGITYLGQVTDAMLTVITRH